MRSWYVPARTRTVSPAPSVALALASVCHGELSVPALPSFPPVATTNVRPKSVLLNMKNSVRTISIVDRRICPPSTHRFNALLFARRDAALSPADKVGTFVLRLFSVASFCLYGVRGGGLTVEAGRSESHRLQFSVSYSFVRGARCFRTHPKGLANWYEWTHPKGLAT
jgi:hypothetical protein